MKISILGSSENDEQRDALVRAMAERLIAEGHHLFHGGIKSGVMKAVAEAEVPADRLAPSAIVCKTLIDKGIAYDGVNTTPGQSFYEGMDEGLDIRRGILTRYVDVAIMFDGGIGTMEEIVSCLKAGTPIIFVVDYWLRFCTLVSFLIGDHILDSIEYASFGINDPPEKTVQDVIDHLAKIEP